MGHFVEPWADHKWRSGLGLRAQPEPITNNSKKTFSLSPALPAPDDGLALYDREVTEVPERVDEHPERQPGLLQDCLGLGNLFIFYFFAHVGKQVFE